LWSLPQAADEASLALYAQRFGTQGPWQKLTPLTHVFTHFKLEIEPRLAQLEQPGVLAQDGASHAWVALRQIDDYGLPAPVRRLLDALGGSLL
jgi:A/G-specific adenine glycosylase